MLSSKLFQGDAVNGNKLPPNYRHQIERLYNSRKPIEEGLEGARFFGCDVNHEKIWQFRRYRLMYLMQYCRLHQVYRENQHDACAERRKHRRGLVSGSIKICQSLAKK